MSKVQDTVASRSDRDPKFKAVYEAERRSLQKMILDPTKQKIGFTSDLHAEHANVIIYSRRPFADVVEMNEALRDRHNEMFDDDSIIFNLGDALLVPRIKGTKRTDPEILQRADDLLGTFKGKIFYIPGNHEHQLDLIQKHWTVLPQLSEVTIKDKDAPRGKQLIVMCHYAMRTWSKAHHRSWHIYGHSHGGLKNDHGNEMRDYPFSLSMDVGVDSNDFRPYLYEDIKLHIATKTFRAIDHHSSRMVIGREVEDLSKY